VRDVTYDGDRSTAYIGNGAQIMASLRNTAINRQASTAPPTSPRPAAPPR
jgi:hypothetical protein